MSAYGNWGGGRPCLCCVLWKFSGYRYTGQSSVDMDISMDIHVKISGYGYGYGWKISYPRQAWRYRVSDVPLSQSRSPARQAKHLCYVIHVCAIEMRFRSAGRSRRRYTCVLAYVRAPPRPLHPCTDCWRWLLAGNSGWSSAVLSHAHHHTAAISKQGMYWRVNSQKLD